ncbi:MAG: hypothetical protein ACRD82_20095 [Blastocatellia bacterium]
MIKKEMAHIRVEIESIEFLLAKYDGVLQDFLSPTPGVASELGVAAILHSFYGGLENIFQRIAKKIDNQIPSGEHWHTDLLKQMIVATEKRPRLLSDDTSAILKEYLQFRHFFRHNYMFVLEHERLDNLVRPLPEVWGKTKSDLEEFVKALESVQE